MQWRQLFLNYYIDLTDKRNIYIFKTLQNMGHNVQSFLFKNQKKDMAENKIQMENPMIKFPKRQASLKYENIVIFSPAKKFTENEIDELPKNSLIFGGSLIKNNLAKLESRNIKYINFLDNDDFVVRNAKLTAEGILALLISNTEKSIFENKILILGSGRVGMATAALLNKLDLNTDIAIFHNDKFAVASFYGKNVVFENQLFERIGQYDVIINTVPFKILKDEFLSKINNNAIILEVASTNCLEKDLLKDYKFKYIPSPALPQRYSAESAAGIMLEIILKFIKQQGQEKTLEK